MNHDDIYVDLTTPRQFTEHGGWNKRCSCGTHLCSHSGKCDCYDLHLKEVQA
jgi:hypothetical protein